MMNETIRRCRVCHCTDQSPCLIEGLPCAWVENDLCTRCTPIEQLVRNSIGIHWLSNLVAVLQLQTTGALVRFGDAVQHVQALEELFEAGIYRWDQIADPQTLIRSLRDATADIFPVRDRL